MTGSKFLLAEGNSLLYLFILYNLWYCFKLIISAKLKVTEFQVMWALFKCLQNVIWKFECSSAKALFLTFENFVLCELDYWNMCD